MARFFDFNKAGCGLALAFVAQLGTPPAAAQPSVAVQPPAAAQPPIAVQPPTATQPPVATESPIAVQAIEATQPPGALPGAGQPSSDVSLNPNPEPVEPTVLPPAGKIAFETHIKPIFMSHCRECHGPRQAKNGFRVDDRAAMLSHIAPGDLQSSALWGDYLVNTDPKSRMPPYKYGKPLSELELAAIRVWIEDGAEWPETPANNMPVPARRMPKNYAEKLFAFVGFFHPAIVHFPIGLLLISGLFTLLSFVKRESFEPAAFHCLWIGALASVAACVAGWSFADVRGYGDFWSTTWNDDAIARHRITGLSVALLSILITGLAYAARRGAGSELRMLWLLASLFLAGVVGLVGHQGGELTYGEDLFDRAYYSAFGHPKGLEAALESYEHPRRDPNDSLSPGADPNAPIVDNSTPGPATGYIDPSTLPAQLPNTAPATPPVTPPISPPVTPTAEPAIPAAPPTASPAPQ